MRYLYYIKTYPIIIKIKKNFNYNSFLLNDIIVYKINTKI